MRGEDGSWVPARPPFSGGGRWRSGAKKVERLESGSGGKTTNQRIGRWSGLLVVRPTRIKRYKNKSKSQKAPKMTEETKEIIATVNVKSAKE